MRFIDNRIGAARVDQVLTVVLFTAETATSLTR
jgi:hypothetical protein